jgi:hypothetical protein
MENGCLIFGMVIMTIGLLLDIIPLKVKSK